MIRLHFSKIVIILTIFYVILIISGCKEYDKEVPISNMLIQDKDELKFQKTFINYTGNVLEANTKKPVEHAQVVIYKKYNNKLEKYTNTYTTSDGSFIISSLEPGYYIIEFLHINYFDKRAYLQILDDKQSIPASLTITLTPIN